MGYTFIALQGFDLIAAVGGEVKRPERNIPRAMILSLTAALVIYMPLLFLIVAVGTPGQAVTDAAAADPEILIAIAARNFLGPTGYWLVIVAGLLSMLSALQANLLAASRFARTMAGDRTLPRRFDRLAPGTGTPIPAIQLTAVTVALVLVAVPNVAAAGAMASLIFLSSFALAHGIAYLARKTRRHRQSLPDAGLPAGAGRRRYLVHRPRSLPVGGRALGGRDGGPVAGHRRRPVHDPAGPRSLGRRCLCRGLDPLLLRLRGRSPLVLVPIANPASAETLVTMANALAPHSVARVLLLSVVRLPEEWAGGECRGSWWTRSRSSAARFRPPLRPISGPRP